MKMIFLALALIVSTMAIACNEDGTSGIVEENDVNIPVNAKRAGGISEEQFNSVIDKIEAIYSPIVSSMGGKLAVARKWTDGTANANASRAFFGNGWKVNMYGGLARHDAITEDGFALVLCHEIGHHLGGAPKTSGGLSSWASNEGQADYFAVLKCLRKTFLNDNNEVVVAALNAPEHLSASCAKTFANDQVEKNICIRTGMAGFSVARFFASMKQKPDPKFDTPDTAVVASTFHAHPAYQCRLDTYFQGSLCDVNMNEDVSQKDEVTGTCHNTLGHTQGTRPLCWFKPSKI